MDMYVCVVLVLCIGSCLTDDVEVGGGELFVETKSGPVKGTKVKDVEDEVEAFLGIPYAEPPVGNLRFRKPVPIKPWNVTYRANEKPSACAQGTLHLQEDFYIDYSTSSENCLYLNIWRPRRWCGLDGRQCKPLPVMVFIYGGAFQWGDSKLFLYDGANFAATGQVIFVTMNYRVGILGFLAAKNPELPGNMGLLDQNLALKWIKENIHNFGGDPESITLSGQSAGAVSVGLHMISPLSKGLFRRAILQSGNTLTLISAQVYNGFTAFQSVASLFNCTDPKRHWSDHVVEIIQCLKTVDSRVLIGKVKELGQQAHAFYPVHGDEFVPQHPLELESAPHISSDNILIGTVRNEGTLFVNQFLQYAPQIRELVNHNYRTGLTVAFSAFFGMSIGTSRGIVNAYFGEEEEHDHDTILKIMSEAVGDVLFDCSTNIFADVLSKRGINGYRYVFDHRPSFSYWDDWMGVVHSDELPFTVGSLPIMQKSLKEETWRFLPERIRSLQATKQEFDFTDQLVHTWSTFAKTGKPPIPESDAEWPIYSERNPQFVYLRPSNYTRGYGPRKETCKLWKDFLLKRPQGVTDSKTTSRPKVFTDKKTPGRKLRPQDNELNSASFSSPESFTFVTLFAILHFFFDFMLS